MQERLIELRAAILADHAAQEKYDPHWKAEAELGRPISQRPIAFSCDDQVVIVGDCVPKIVDGLRQFLCKVEDNSAVWQKRRANEPAVAQAIAQSERWVAFEGDEINVPSKTWNGLLLALNEIGIDVVTTGGECTASTTP